MQGRTEVLRNRLKRGLTLGEMLIVLAVFLILATMFLFSSQYAIIKSKSSRVFQDQRTVVLGISQYYSNYAHVPDETAGLAALTANGALLSTVPDDPFSAGSRGPQKLGYFPYISNEIQCLVVSVGPDGLNDVAEAIEAKREATQTLAGGSGPTLLFRSKNDAELFIAQKSYDPTNGSVSAGDIIRFYKGD